MFSVHDFSPPHVFLNFEQSDFLLLYGLLYRNSLLQSRLLLCFLCLLDCFKNLMFDSLVMNETFCAPESRINSILFRENVVALFDLPIIIIEHPLEFFECLVQAIL